MRGHSMVVLTVRPPEDCAAGTVEVHVRQRSSGAELPKCGYAGPLGHSGVTLGDLGSTAASDDIQWEPQTPAPTPAAAGEPAMDAAAGGQPQWDEAATKLDLAKAYIDMGDADGARSILQEVMTEGSEAQKQQAQTLSAQLA